MKHEGKTSMEYSFGKIVIKVGVNAKVDQPSLVIDHMLTTAQTVMGIEVVNQGISEMRNNGTTEQTCATTVNFGDIEVLIRISFSIKRLVTKRTLNSMVFEAVLPKILETAGIYFGNHQALTTPPAPLTPRSRQEARDSVQVPLALGSPIGDQHDLSQVSNGQRQLQTSH